MAHEFDELSKVLAGRVPRREALQRIGGGLTGAALAGLGSAAGQALTALPAPARACRHRLETR